MPHGYILNSEGNPINPQEGDTNPYAVGGVNDVTHFRLTGLAPDLDTTDLTFIVRTAERHVLDMSLPEIQDRIYRLKATLDKIKAYQWTLTKKLNIQKLAMNEEQAEELRKVDAKYKPKVITSTPKVKATPKTVEEKEATKLKKAGFDIDLSQLDLSDLT